MSQNSALVLFDIAEMLAVGVCLAIPMRRLRQPKVLGEILAGLALGPSLLGRCWRSPLTGMDCRGSVTVGLLMSTRGLTELVLLNVGLTMGILDGRMFTMLVVMALVTTAMTGPSCRFAPTRGLMRNSSGDHRVGGAGADADVAAGSGATVGRR